jgi:hypothetical protein
MSDNLQPIYDEMADFKDAVAVGLKGITDGLNEIVKLAAGAGTTDRAAALAIAADIKTQADAVRAGAKSIEDAIGVAEAPPAPTPAPEPVIGPDGQPIVPVV